MIGQGSGVLPGETPEQYRQRRLRELEAQGEPLRARVTEGRPAVPGWLWGVIALGVFLTWR